VRLVSWSPGWHGQRVCRYLPRAGEVFLRISDGSRWYHIQWLPREGYWVTSAGTGATPGEGVYHWSPRFQSDAMKRRQVAAPGEHKLPALPMASTILAKLPALREFLTATEYEDGGNRQPGYMTMRNRGTTFEVTLYDPDSGHRIACRGTSFDETLLLAEKLLGTPEAPWEVDQYLTDQLAKRSRKKK